VRDRSPRHRSLKPPVLRRSPPPRADIRRAAALLQRGAAIPRLVRPRRWEEGIHRPGVPLLGRPAERAGALPKARLPRRARQRRREDKAEIRRPGGHHRLLPAIPRPAALLRKAEARCRAGQQRVEGPRDRYPGGASGRPSWARPQPRSVGPGQAPRRRRPANSCPRPPQGPPA